MGGYSRLFEEELFGVPPAAMSARLPEDILMGMTGWSGSAAMGLVMVKMSLKPAFSEVSLAVLARTGASATTACAGGAGTVGRAGAADGGGGFLGG